MTDSQANAANIVRGPTAEPTAAALTGTEVSDAAPASQAEPVAGQTAPGSVALSGAVALARPTAAAVAERAASAAQSTAPPAPPPSSAGTVYSSRGATVARRRPGRGATPLRVGVHAASHEAVDLLAMPHPNAGVLLGTGQGALPVAVRLIRREPTRLVVLGGAWLVPLLAFRVLATGARVVVRSSSAPERWQELGTWATGRPGRLSVAGAGSSEVDNGGPTLVISEAGISATEPPPDRAWLTQLTAIGHCSQETIGAALRADTLLAANLSTTEVDVLARAMGLSDAAATSLSTLAPDMLALGSGAGIERILRVAITPVERQYFGTALPSGVG
jgi:hypothetical protein